MNEHFPLHVKYQLIKLFSNSPDVITENLFSMNSTQRKPAEHGLYIKITSIKCEQGNLSLDRSKSINARINDVLQTKILPYEENHNNIANTTLVEEENGTWCMYTCVINQGKICSKENYPLPIVNFLEKLGTDKSINYYKEMPLGLKSIKIVHQTWSEAKKKEDMEAVEPSWEDKCMKQKPRTGELHLSANGGMDDISLSLLYV